jgi:hypothetical protein
MFDDDHAVADAGLALVGVLSEKLGLIEFAEEMVNVPPFPGRRIATLVHAICAGAGHIDHANVLRAGATGSSALKAIAVGPCRMGSSSESPAIPAASVTRVFFSTRYSTPAARSCRRRSPSSATVRPR